MAELQAVDHDPFEGSQFTEPDVISPQGRLLVGTSAKGSLQPVDHDPFATDYTGVAKQAGVGVAKGTIGLAGIIGDIQQIAKKAGSYLPDIKADPESEKYARKYGRMGDVMSVGQPPEFPTSHDIQGQVEKVTGEFRKPQNQTEADAETVGEFLPAALAGPGSLARKVVTQDAIPAAASIVAGRYSDQNPYVKALAGFLGGGAGITISGPNTAEKLLRDKIPASVTEQDITRAGQLIDHAQTRGVALTWPEALSRVTGQPVLTDTQRILESHGQTRPQMQEFFADRPGQVEHAARAEFDQVGNHPAYPSTIGPQAGEAANETLTGVRQSINNAAEPYYQNSASVLLSPAEMSHVRAIPGWTQARDAVRNNPQLNWRVANLPDHSVGFLNEVKKHFDQAAENAASKFNPARNHQVQASNEMAASAVKQIAIAKSAQRPRSQSIPDEAPSDLYRGYGRENKSSVYGAADVPILGEGKYFAFDQNVAEKYGPNIEKNRLEDVSSNPLVITDGNQWRKLTKEAGWEFPNPFGQDKSKLEASTKRLQDLVKEKGHDGIVVWWNDANKYDSGPNGENIKLLRDVFDKPQALAFKGYELPPHVNNYEVALEIGRRGRQQFLEPLLQGPLGKLAKKDITTQKAIAALFPENPVPGTAGEISDAVSALVQRRPAAAEQLVRAHVEMVFNQAARDLQGGANQFAGAKFAAKLAGGAQQRENLRAAIEALPNGAARWQGFERILDIMAATGTRQPKGSLTAFNQLEVQSMSTGGLQELASKGLSPGKWMSFANDAFKSWSLGRNLDQIARIITDPRSGEALRQIVRIPPGSDRALVMAGRLIALGSATTTEQRTKGSKQ